MSGPDVKEDKVEKAMKEGKAVGEDGLAIKMLHALDGFSIKKMTNIVNKIYQSGDFNEDMCQSICKTIPKKSGILECNRQNDKQNESISEINLKDCARENNK